MNGKFWYRIRSPEEGKIFLHHDWDMLWALPGHENVLLSKENLEHSEMTAN